MDARMERAIQAAEEGDTEEARGLLRQVLHSDPDNEDAWLLMANTASSERDRRVALRQVLRIDPDNQTAWEMLTGTDGTDAPAPPPPDTASAADEATEDQAPEESAAEEDSEEASIAVAATAGVAAAAGTAGEPGPDAAAGAAAEAAEPAATPPPEPEPFEPLPAPPVDAPAPPPAYEPWEDSEPRPWLPLLIALLVAACIVVTLTVGVLYAPKFRTEAGPTATLALVGPTVSEPGELTGAPSGDAALAPGAEESSEPPADRAEGAFSAEAQAPLPDLVVKWVKIELESDTGCMEPGDELGTTVNVYNAGDDSAAPFALDVNGTLVDVPTGLAAGEQTFVWAPGYTSGAETIVQVDAASEVEESDEENNVYGQFVPIPTPLPTCAPPPETSPSGTEIPSEEGARAPGAFDAPPISVANAASLAPVRITTRSDYSDGPTSFMQFEVDEQGNMRLAVDTPDGLEEWFFIDGVTYAGEASAEGLTPYQAVDEPQKVAGFANPFDLFAPRGDTDCFATAFPLQAVLWWGTPERTERQGTEPIHGLEAEEYTIAVKPEGAPQEAYVGTDRSEDLAAAVSAGDPAPLVTLWVEPQSGAILQAEWNVDLPSGARAQYRLDVAPVGVGPFALPSADMPNPAAQHCADQGYQTEIRTEAGGEVGYCVFADGNACEEWAFYRGECTAETAAPLAAEAPAADSAADEQVAVDDAVAKVITEYWTSVGSGDFDVAWAHLTDAYRQREYEDDYGLYKEDLQNPKLCSTAPTVITWLRGDADESVLYTSLQVERGRKCKKRTYEFEMRLVFDADSEAWLIADMTRLD